MLIENRLTFRLFDCFFFDDFWVVCELVAVAAVTVVAAVAAVAFTLVNDIAMLLTFVKFGVPLWPSN